MKKYLVLVSTLCMLAVNAYAYRYDATGEWDVTNNWTFTPDPGVPTSSQTGTDYRTWTIVDNLIDNTFQLEYAGPAAAFTVSGNYDPIENTYYVATPFTHLSTSDSSLNLFESLSFWLKSPTTLEGESSILKSYFNGSEWNQVGSIACCYTGQPVPEPATMILLGLGLIGLAGFRKKIKN